MRYYCLICERETDENCELCENYIDVNILPIVDLPIIDVEEEENNGSDKRKED